MKQRIYIDTPILLGNIATIVLNIGKLELFKHIVNLTKIKATMP
jgi:hypothetical protein